MCSRTRAGCGRRPTAWGRWSWSRRARWSATRSCSTQPTTALAALTPDGGVRYQAFWDWVAETTPSEPHWFLDQLAVEPAAQGRGIGRALLEHAIGLARADGRPLVLETGTPDNVALYERFGFRVIRAEDAPGGGPRVWWMRRDPA